MAEISEDDGVGVWLFGGNEWDSPSREVLSFLFSAPSTTPLDFSKNTKHLDVKILHLQQLRSGSGTKHQLFTA